MYMARGLMVWTINGSKSKENGAVAHIGTIGRGSNLPKRRVKTKKREKKQAA